MIVPLILSGGRGTRLWPLSRELYPKQYLPLAGDNSLFQETLLRVKDLDDCSNPLVVCNNVHRFICGEQLQHADMKAEALILEPEGRNTAPAVAVGALHAVRMNKDAVLLVLPADHRIENNGCFEDVVKLGAEQAASGQFVCFGITPDHPATGYGYIHCGDEVASKVNRISEFVEKPDADRAAQYIVSGDYLWNSGMFMFSAQAYLDALGRLEPDMLKACTDAVGGEHADLDFVRLDEEAFCCSPSNSIDYAVMEKVDNSVVIPFTAGWSDLGSFDALHAVGKQDENGNTCVGDVLAENTSGCYLHSDDKLLAAVGVKDIVTVVTKDAVLVAPRENSQDVKLVVQALRDAGRNEADVHAKVYRPWGSYETIDMEERFQVKRITVKPGAELSLQKHHHRAEHWIIVAGTAEVTRNDEFLLLTENESVYIPLGATHRLKNPGMVPLELIEVQSGSYLGEDDIVRFEDNYGREGRTDMS